MTSVSYKFCRPITVIILISCFMFLSLYIWYFRDNGNFNSNDTGPLIQYILCFGDSLTKGNTGNGKYHPYSKALRKHLNIKRLESKHRGEFIVHTSCFNGEKAQTSMESRLQTLLRKTKYHWVIILGGTNDLGLLLSNNQSDVRYDEKCYKPILNALIKLHKMVLNNGGKTVVVTIPGRLCENMAYCKELKAARIWLNDKLRDFAEKNKVVLADLDKAINFNKFSKFWSDEVHFTPDGYDALGKIIYKSMSHSLDK